KALYKKIEEDMLFPNGDFSLEVSSAGVDEPLRFLRQYKKNTGRTVEVTLNDDTKVTGILKTVEETEICVEETVGKKKEIITKVLPFSNIKQTIVQVTF